MASIKVTRSQSRETLMVFYCIDSKIALWEHCLTLQGWSEVYVNSWLFICVLGGSGAGQVSLWLLGFYKHSSEWNSQKEISLDYSQVSINKQFTVKYSKEGVMDDGLAAAFVYPVSFYSELQISAK